MKRTKPWEFIATNILSLASITVGFVVIILQGIGILSNEHTNLVILGVLTFLATSQVVETNKKFENLKEQVERSFEDTISALGGIEIKRFETPEAGYKYIGDRILNAQLSIDHIALSGFKNLSKKTSHGPNSEYQKFRQARDKVLRKNKVSYRYVVGGEIEKSKLIEIKNWLADPLIGKLHIGVYNLSSEERIGYPYPSIIIFDKKEVFLYFPRDVGQSEITYAIKHPNLVEMCSNYFERVWTPANIIDMAYVEKMLPLD